MKRLILLFFILLFIGCNYKSNNKDKSFVVDSLISRNDIEIASWDTFALGDLNNDKTLDTAFIYTPPLLKQLNKDKELQYYYDCLDSNCFNLIKFSCKLPNIKIENSVWGSIEAIGDLNNDGISELIFSPSWFTSCWGKLFVYRFEMNKWNIISEVLYYRCAEENLKSHVLKKKNKYFLIGSEFIDGDEVQYQVEIK